MFVADTLRQMGLTVDVSEPRTDLLRKSTVWAPTEWGYGGRPNVVGILPGQGGGHSLILNAHIDVVSPEPRSAWKSDPWNPFEEDGKLVGSGAADDKAGIAVIIMALRCLESLGIKLKGDLI